MNIFVLLGYLNGRQYGTKKKINFIMHDPKYYRSVLGATAQHMRIYICIHGFTVKKKSI